VRVAGALFAATCCLYFCSLRFITSPAIDDVWLVRRYRTGAVYFSRFCGLVLDRANDASPLSRSIVTPSRSGLDCRTGASSPTAIINTAYCVLLLPAAGFFVSGDGRCSLHRCRLPYFALFERVPVAVCVMNLGSGCVDGERQTLPPRTVTLLRCGWPVTLVQKRLVEL